MTTKIGASAPSNIAFIKYWGKKEDQKPINPSLSMTLKECTTTSHVSFRPSDNMSVKLYLNQVLENKFSKKVEDFLISLSSDLPWIKRLEVKIETSNTFPHGTGIASSASGMAALSVNIITLEELVNPDETDDYYVQKASLLARLGSGSACRSIKGNIVVWGETESIENSSDLFGVDFPYEVNSVFENYQDTILLVDKGEKQVSSTVGHELMHNHPFAERRFQQAHENIAKLKGILKSGNLEQFIALVESEALTLHAMMMTSMPYFILMKPNTLEIINQIWKFRETTSIPVCFTLDAGANVHVLYPNKYKADVQKFIADELAKYCQNNQFIHDEMGFGTEVLS